MMAQEEKLRDPQSQTITRQLEGNLNGDPSHSCQDISLKPQMWTLLLALDEKILDHKMLCQSM